MDARQVVNKWLSEQGKRSSEMLDPTDYAELRSLLAPHRGFGVFWSLLAFDRESFQLELNNANLGTEEGRAKASELQGSIRAIDGVHDLIVSIAEPEMDGSSHSGIGQER